MSERIRFNLHLVAALLLALGVSLTTACGDDGGGGADGVANNTQTPEENNDPPQPNNTPNNDAGTPLCDNLPTTLTVGDEGGELRVEGDGLRVGGDSGVTATLSWRLESGAAPTGSEVTVRCLDDDITPEGFAPLGPAILLDGPAGVRPALMRAQLPFDVAQVPEGIKGGDLRIFVQIGEDQLRSPALLNLHEDMAAGLLSFDTHLFGAYQVGLADTKVTPSPRRVTFRAITGASMGAGAAAQLGFKNPELFDIIGALGGASDWRYMVRYVREAGLGGFCPRELVDIDDPATWRCDTFTPDLDFEHGMSFDEWYSPSSQGAGGDFSRFDYINIFQDLTFLAGNMSYYNPDNPMTPPGMGFEEFLRDPDEVCPQGGLVIENGYFDNEYNPDGTLPVIAFCDGAVNNDPNLPWDRACDLNNDGVPDDPNRGLYLGPEPQRRPFGIGLAVDYNGNGRRDIGEPVIRNFWEPWEDLGADALADVDEPGYDPVLNPDPSGDNYHYLYNPLGTEKNWRWDEGEPWEDTGLDGVADTAQVGEGGYDWGEGNGEYDLNPNLDALFAANARDILAAMPPDEREQVLRETRLYADGGIRDLFNFATATNTLAGAVHGLGGNVRFYDDFTSMAQVDSYLEIDTAALDYNDLGDHVMVRYGNPEATPTEICQGDGEHVGTINQIVYRLALMLGFVVTQMPVDEAVNLPQPPPRPNGVFSVQGPDGRRLKYSIALPPGYEYTQCTDGEDNDGDGLVDGLDPDCVSGDHTNEAGPEPLTRCNDGINNDRGFGIDMEDPECSSPEDDSESDFFEDARFPVVYIMHGYGQSPEDLTVSILAVAGYMARGVWPKAILVFPSGACNDRDFTQCNDGIDNDGDNLIDDEDPRCQEGDDEGEERLEDCEDGVDNDGDGLVDFGGDNPDHGCTSANDRREGNCNRGTFYMDHAAYPDGTSPGPPYEALFLNLVDHVDEHYRTLAPVTLEP